MRQIIVRADDLGFSEGINYGIEKSIKQGIIQSVGIMVNMDATNHGWQLVKDTNVCFGLHTNICVGKPLTDPKLIPSICDESGNLKASKVYRASKEDFVVYDEVKMEIEAQYQRFVELTGQKPHYFEGHAVQSLNFAKALEDVAKEHGCDFLAFPMGKPVKFRNTDIYCCMDSMMPDYDPFESLKRACLKDYGNGVCMFVCHPGYLDAYILSVSSLTIPRTLEVEMLTSDATKQWLKENEIQVISYDDIR